MSVDKFGGYKTEAKERTEMGQRLCSAKKQGEIGETLGDIRGAEKGDRNETVFSTSPWASQKC